MFEHEQFLHEVADYVRKNPEIAARTVEATQRGINQALEETRQRAVDMETALACAMNARLKNWKYLVVNILGKWRHKTALSWEHDIKQLEKDLEQCRNK